MTLFADLPEALENTVEIAKRCAFKTYKRDPILPKFADDEIVELRRQANEGLQKRLAVIPHAVSLRNIKNGSILSWVLSRAWGSPAIF